MLLNQLPEILQQVAEGRQDAFRALMQQHANLLESYIFRLTKNASLTEEIVQDVFLQIWQSRETLSRIRNFKSYLFVISRNHAVDALRKMIREQRDLHHFAADHQHANEEPLIDELKWNIIDEAIAQLPAQQQKVWILCRREKKKYAEVARELSLSRETVKYYLKLANASILQYVTQRIAWVWIGILATDYFKR